MAFRSSKPSYNHSGEGTSKLKWRRVVFALDDPFGSMFTKKATAGAWDLAFTTRLTTYKIYASLKANIIALASFATSFNHPAIFISLFRTEIQSNYCSIKSLLLFPLNTICLKLLSPPTKKYTHTCTHPIQSERWNSSDKIFSNNSDQLLIYFWGFHYRPGRMIQL